MKAQVADNLKEAMLYRKQPGGHALCDLCPHRCLIQVGQQGLCQTRENRAGTLYTTAYHRTVTEQVDPVEKKPLFHFHPGSTAYSIATRGCNFQCQYCTNWMISQRTNGESEGAGQSATPERIVAAAQRAGCRSVAYTYVEPTIFFELVYDTARLARASGLANIYKTNGYMTPEALDVCRSFLDAANVDLKAFRDATYKRFGGRLRPVLDSLKRMRSLGVWLEVTTVIIPGVNDDHMEIRDTADFIARELGSETPWHLSRFFPAYLMADTPPTPIETLLRAREIGREAGLDYIYFNNVPLSGSQDTSCVRCGRALIRRRGVDLLANEIKQFRCPNCGTPVPGTGL